MNAQNTDSAQVLQRQAASLLVYQSALQDEVGQAYLNLLQTLTHSDPDPARLDCLQAYGHWFRLLADRSRSWPEHLLMQILRDDNPFSRQVQQSTPTALPPALLAAVRHDLQVLQRLHRCDGPRISQWVKIQASLPDAPVAWESDLVAQTERLQIPIWNRLGTLANWADALEDLAAYYRSSGVGLFAEYWALRWQQGQLQGIAYPDPVRLSDLTGYSYQQEALTQNTEALLSGYRALHVLLYGSRGSGKSSLVKGLLNQYGDRGLRLIEVLKSELQALPQIVDQLRSAPQKFIIFVDDLSFEEDNDAYKALKVVLEGNVTARPQNVVVYATSNRKHLIREFFGDRPRPSDADEIHSWDTVQEKLSFSDRFGLTLTFEPADQNTYLAIVRQIAQQAEIKLEPQDLEFRALQWATRHNGRSGRTARQFIDFLQAELALKDSVSEG